jgi:acyl transferase domain-containing protein/NADPH:quinone reductase-like Zn-dependent oxidoreductase
VEIFENEKFAVVGMSCRFPDATTLDEYWQNLKQGKESVTFLTDEELLENGIPKDVFSKPNYVKATSVIANIDKFDAEFFDISPNEAELIDPQHRFFLMCCWEAIEHAGYAPKKYPGSVGVFAGSGRNMYFRNYVCPPANSIESIDGSVQGLRKEIGNYPDFFTTRVSYKLNLTGPSINIQTACSTSLVAIHLACQSLLTGESDLALAGGVTISLPQKSGYISEEGAISSQDGHCRAFDVASTGTFFGNGVGVVAIKRLEDAIEDRDTIHAIVLGSSINNDGNDKASYSAPSISGQCSVIQQALSTAGINSHSISYIEAHGTGTRLGDPIEISALADAFGRKEMSCSPCAIGTVKTNFGHLGAAAGVAGFIKVVLALKNRIIPPSLHFTNPNPGIDFDGLKFYVPSSAEAWEPEVGLRRACVSSFGIGGTNAHVILEEPPIVEQQAVNEKKISSPLIFPVSARTPEALDDLCSSLDRFLSKNSNVSFQDIAFTLCEGREQFKCRKAVVASEFDELRSGFKLTEVGQLIGKMEPEPIFLFPGQGAKFYGSALEYSSVFPSFAKIVKHCCSLLASEKRLQLEPILFGHSDVDPQLLLETRVAQPALFTLQYALAQLLMEWGVQPRWMLGHSVGELTAACVAGVFSLEDGLKIAATRGELMNQAPKGKMLAVWSDDKTLQSLLPPDVVIASYNSRNQVVVSGPSEQIYDLEKLLTKKQIHSFELRVTRAFHSPAMHDAAEIFYEFLSKVELHAPEFPLLSCFTGKAITAQEARSPQFWSSQIMKTVQFSQTTQFFENKNVFGFELGSGGTLSKFFQESVAGPHKFYSLISAGNQVFTAKKYFLEIIGRAWELGLQIDFSSLFCGSENRIPLPTYPFQLKRYWYQQEHKKSDLRSSLPSSTKDSLTSEDTKDIPSFRIPTWEPIHLGDDINLNLNDYQWLIIGRTTPDISIRSDIIDHFNLEHVIWLSHANYFTIIDSGLYELDLCSDKHLETFVQHHLSFEKPFAILNLTSVIPNRSEYNPKKFLNNYSEEVGFNLLGIVSLIRNLAPHLREQDSHSYVFFITIQSQSVLEGDLKNPDGALVAGPQLVISQEYPFINASWIDLQIEPPSEKLEKKLLFNAFSSSFVELRRNEDNSQVAYRNGTLYIKGWKNQSEFTKSISPTKIKDSSVMITGGLGGIGLILAEKLAQLGAKQITLCSRSPFSLKNPNFLTGSLTGNAQKKEILERLKRYQVELRTAQMDVADINSIKAIANEHGPFDLIVHSAGIPSGGLISGRTSEEILSVLSPKVLGAINLDQVFSGSEIMVFCSSLTGSLGYVGQVDYSSANAFLDALAFYRSQVKGLKTVSIAWDRWNSIGMAVDVSESGNQIDSNVYGIWEGDEFSLSLKKDWPLDEHQLDGNGILPGTAILNIFWTKAKQLAISKGKAVLEDIAFLSPAITDSAGTLQLRLELKGQGEDTFIMKLYSLNKAFGKNLVSTCCIKLVDMVTFSSEQEETLSELQDLLQPTEYSQSENEALFTSTISFGERWSCIRQFGADAQQALAKIQLSDHYINDLEKYEIHPAVMDCLLGHFVHKISKGRTYLPFGYKRVALKTPIPGEAWSLIRLKSSGSKDSLIFDVKIFDKSGEQLGFIEDYVLRPIALNKVQTKPLQKLGDNFSLRIFSPGDFKSLDFICLPRKALQEGEVEVEVAATGLNFKEVLMALGILPCNTKSYDFGLEFSGVVSRVGSSVTQVRVGDRVAGFSSGSFGKFVVTDNRLVELLPENLTFDMAATIPVAFTTAYHSLCHLGRLKEGDKVLIHAATGGVGLAAIQIAQKIGAEIFATAGSDRKRDYLRVRGIAHVFNSRSVECFVDIDRVTNGHGMDVILNSLSGDFITRGIESLAPGGRFVEIGKKDLIEGMNISLRAFDQGLSFITCHPDILETDFLNSWKQVMIEFHNGSYSPLPIMTYPLNEVSEAFAFMAKAKHIGKIVTVNENAGRLASNVIEKSISPHLGQQLFLQALEQSKPFVSVDLNFRLERKNTRQLRTDTRSSRKTAHRTGKLIEKFETKTEEVIATVWSSFLGVKNIGRDSNFTELGGDSLMATQVVAQLEQDLGYPVSIASLFQTASLKEFASLCESSSNQSSTKVTSSENGLI